MLHITFRNDSTRKALYRSDQLRRLAARICEGEGFDGEAEVSVVFCDNPFVQELNRAYRKKNAPTDVLSFGYDPAGHPAPVSTDCTPCRVLGDIVISLETVEERSPGNRDAMRGEVRLLFCHGILHLLGFCHGTERERTRMAEKQALYLGVDAEAAWGRRPVRAAKRR